MRLSSAQVPLLILVCYVPVSVVLSLPALQSFFFLLALFALRSLLVLGSIGKKTYKEDYVLESISLSHYVEKVRWCLDYLHIPYHEEENVGILGIFLLGRRVPQLSIPALGITISNSSDILRYLLGKHITDPKVVQLLTPTPESLQLEEKFDRLGVVLRVVLYNKIFFETKDSRAVIRILWGLHQPNIPQWQKVLLTTLTPVLSAVVINRLKVGTAEAAASLKEAGEIFKEVDSMLADGRKFLLATDHPTYLDFHFAAMAGLILMQENYGGRVVSHQTKQQLAKVAASLASEAEPFKASAAGQFAQRIYETHRLV